MARGGNAEALALARSALGDDAVPGRLAPSDTRPIPGVDGLAVPGLYAAIEHIAGDNGLELPLVNTVAALRAHQLGAIQLEGAEVKVSRADVLAAKAPGCRTKAGRTYAWLVRDRVPAGAADAGRERLRALLLVRCGRVEVRDGAEDVALPQVAVYDADGRLALTAGPGYVNAFRWTAAGGRPVLAGGSAVYADGRTAELTGPDVAQK